MGNISHEATAAGAMAWARLQSTTPLRYMGIYLGYMLEELAHASAHATSGYTAIVTQTSFDLVKSMLS